jgi:hypothetical protein
VPLAKRLLDISGGGSAALSAIALYEGLTSGDTSLVASAKKVFINEVRCDNKLLYIALRKHLSSLASIITGDGASSAIIINIDDDVDDNDPSKYLSMKHLLDKTMFMERLGSSSSSMMRPTSTTTTRIPIPAEDWSRVLAIDAMEDALTQLHSTQREHFAASGLGPPLVRSSAMRSGGSVLLPVMGLRCHGERCYYLHAVAGPVTASVSLHKVIISFYVMISSSSSSIV